MTVLSSHHPRYRTKLCRHIANGSCPYGQKCSFIHPAPPIDPLSASFAQSLMCWSALLPHIVAISNQQAAMNKMLRQHSPPRHQGPKLVDEDPSPTISLLLSASDCTSSEQVSRSRRSREQPPYSCRYFTRTGGRCPNDAQCRLQHDVAALPIEAVHEGEQVSPSEADHKDQVRAIRGGVLMRMQSPSVTGQMGLEPPQETEPERVQSVPFLHQLALNTATRNGLADQQPVCWPGYPLQPYQSHCPTVPATNTVPVSAPIPTVEHNVYQPARATIPNDAASPADARVTFPVGAYQVNGTTYFPTQVPAVPARAPVVYPISVHSTPYTHSMVPVYPYLTAPLPASHHDTFSNPVVDAHHPSQTRFSPFSPELMTSSEPPAALQLEDHYILPLSLPSGPVLTRDLSPTRVVDTLEAITQAHPMTQEFPYEPPKNHRVGHARRISVNVKKHARGSSYSG